jgi:Putative Flp pilus-assembly TadE/G-like
VSGERGQASILIIGFAVILMMATGVVVDASAAYLQRQSLAALADGAALAGADQVAGRPVYVDGVEQEVPIDPAIARTVVAAYLRDIGAYDDHPGLSFAVTTRRRHLIVRVSAPLDLPITVDGVTDTTVSASGSAAVVADWPPVHSPRVTWEQTDMGPVHSPVDTESRPWRTVTAPIIDSVEITVASCQSA